MVKLMNADMAAPTVLVYDAASRLTLKKEALASVEEATHQFTFDNLGRPLDSDYAGLCQTFNVPDIVRIYDGLTGAPSCPSGTSCANLAGRLAYVKVKLMCTTSAGPDSDYTLEQETWYGYDAAGRLTHEYISDDNGRTAAHIFAWTKNGALEQTTLPSTTVLGATYGSAGSNSDKDRITALWRTTSGAPIVDNVLYEPFGPVSQYNQQNSPGTGVLRTRIARNLAYRQTLNIVEKTDGTNIQSSVTLAEDNKGRVTQRDYYPSDPTIAGRYDSFYQYDQQDRVICEASASGTCPTSGSTLKNNHNATPRFTAAGDWKSLLRPIPGSTGFTHSITLSPGTHFPYQVTQNSGSPTYGVTWAGGNSVGDRSYDDNSTTLTHDLRTPTYDGRRNVVNVRGEYKVGANWNFYDVASAFDAKNRRVFKSFYNETTLKTATWFFYYDALDRLREIKYTPDTSASSTYSVFQLIWLGDKLVLYWQTDYPSVTTSKRYVSTDETNRPIDMMSWPASGVAARVWTIYASAWGFDGVLVGSGVFQPILFAGQYKDDETVAWQNDGTTRHRPGVVLNGYRTYDPWLGIYLQIDPLVDSTWSPYVYVNSDPVGKVDRNGLTSCTTADDGTPLCWQDEEIIVVEDTAPSEGGPTFGNWNDPNCPSGFCSTQGPNQPPPRPPTPPPPPPPPCKGTILDMVACVDDQIWDSLITFQKDICEGCFDECIRKHQPPRWIFNWRLGSVLDGSYDWEANLAECKGNCYQQSLDSPAPPDVTRGEITGPGCYY